MKEKLKNWKILYGIIFILLIIIVILSVMLVNKENTINTSNIQKTTEIDDNTNSISGDNTISKEDEDSQKQEENINGKDLIRIKSVSTSKPNSANGVDLEIKWTNMSDKVIKYITFTAYPLNAVGDIVECTIRSRYHGEFRGKETGPINKGEGSKEGYAFMNAWYNNTIVKATLMQVDIEYMDGSKVSLTGNNLNETIY